MKRNFGTLTLEGSSWVLGRIEPHVAIRLKQMFPRISKSTTEKFKFPNDPQHCADLDWFCSRYPMEMPASHRTKLNRGRIAYERTQVELGQVYSPDYQPPSYTGIKDGFSLRPYQAQAIETLRRIKGLLLGDDLGLGKTYEAAGFLLLTEARPAAVVVQTHLQQQWADKITEFTTLQVHLIKGTKPYNLPQSDVYVFRYSQLLGWIDTFATMGFKTAVFDEVQELRTGGESAKGRAARKLADHVQFRLGLSATPIYNYGAEIWNIMQCIAPDVLGNSGEFHREWCPSGMVTDPKALGTYLREQHVFLRRTKKEVGQQIPPINRIVEIVSSDETVIANISTTARRLALQTITGEFTERGQASRELDLLVRHATGVGKAASVAAYVRILLEADIPVMLIGWHRDVYEQWLTLLADFRPVMFTGSESPKQKIESKRRFVSGETKLFIMSLRSGAGLDDLQHVCSTVVFGEMDWSPKVHEQVIGRLYRDGQTEQVTAIYLNSEDGSDPPMVDLLGIKSSQSSGIVDPHQVFEPVVSDISRVRALALQYLSKQEAKTLELVEED